MGRVQDPGALTFLNTGVSYHLVLSYTRNSTALLSTYLPVCTLPYLAMAGVAGKYFFLKKKKN